MSWKNGRRYEGQWKDGKKDGLGIEYGANGAVDFNGEWKDDVFVKGKLWNPDGSLQYQGIWEFGAF